MKKINLVNGAAILDLILFDLPIFNGDYLLIFAPKNKARLIVPCSAMRVTIHGTYIRSLTSQCQQKCLKVFDKNSDFALCVIENQDGPIVLEWIILLQELSGGLQAMAVLRMHKITESIIVSIQSR